MESQLRIALQKGEFLLHYQPQVDAQTAAPTGMEVLVRWSRNGSQDLVSPADFIPILEDTGLIIPLGEWTLQQACRQYMIWKKTLNMPDLQLSVNISVKQFSISSFPDTVARALAASNMPPHLLCLELTESIVMHDLPGNLQILKVLNSMGVKLSIDDFGTGYSSLSYLRRLPIDELKIDRSFITGLPTDFHDAAIVSTIVGLAHYLNIQVVAEGVENDGQGQFLALQGCHVLQGYLHSRPLAPDAMEQWLRTSLVNEIQNLFAKSLTAD
jgi:EAL domain-containing protein (putative c-di-GMP-specific phosphodiesterase class I)